MSLQPPGVDSRFRRDIERSIRKGKAVPEHRLGWRFAQDLLEYEHWWTTFYAQLSVDGYRLRERFDPTWVPKFMAVPDWAPAWVGHRPLRGPWENGARMLQPYIMDAVRVADDLRVIIKSVPLEDGRCHEARIMRILQQPAVATDRRNHCISLLDFKVYPGSTRAFLMVPYLLPFDVVPFETVGEVLDFVRQVVEGVDFMHSLNVAHRDIAGMNVMMFSPDLFPGGINYLYPGLTPERSSRTAAHLSRREVYIRYYLIDFGLSWAFKNVASRRPMCTGFGRYKDAPELSDTVPYDGFALDMWCIGKLIKEEIFERYDTPIFLHEYVATLMLENPPDRPTAHEALADFDFRLQSVPEEYLQRRLPNAPRNPRSIRRLLSLEGRAKRRLPLDAPPPVFPLTSELSQLTKQHVDSS